ncbi:MULTISPECIES: hypothetical protein [Pseudomonas syringae group]|uniref:hypothetical protein n=1 Tax=Pseudomonas syringae group TaxID=136849 RepID=UPI0006D6391C|nr:MULTISPECIES: hypothetical protein [Pseudomonas syringae group]KPW41129.1 Uncharacterized protein ALO66_02813 [Pseudomonas coronafaciens pv. atropurpurea]
MENHRRLSSAENHKIHVALQASLRSQGVDLLGSQLGQFIAKAVAPKSIKSLGGVRSIVDSDLSDAVEFVEPRQSDFLFRIKLKAAEPLRELVEPVVVSGMDLWRYFSNPNVPCALGVDLEQRVIVTPPDQPFDSSVKQLRRMEIEEYRQLAELYAKEQVDPTFKQELMSIVEDSWLYAKWIACLRYNRGHATNYLKSWEIKRSELVIGRLRDELEKAGLEPTLATVVADGGRPQGVKPRGSETAVIRLEQPTETPMPRSQGDGDVSELAQLRALLREAVDYMSLDDLKAIRVPLGVVVKVKATFKG